ncbi:hypothetical protein H4S04_004669, partial [Coemansia sp. S16]
YLDVTPRSVWQIIRLSARHGTRPDLGVPSNDVNKSYWPANLAPFDYKSVYGVCANMA